MGGIWVIVTLCACPVFDSFHFIPPSFQVSLALGVLIEMRVVPVLFHFCTIPFLWRKEGHDFWLWEAHKWDWLSLSPQVGTVLLIGFNVLLIGFVFCHHAACGYIYTHTHHKGCQEKTNDVAFVLCYSGTTITLVGHATLESPNLNHTSLVSPLITSIK